MNVGEALHRWAIRLKSIDIAFMALTGKVGTLVVSVAITTSILNLIK